MSPYRLLALLLLAVASATGVPEAWAEPAPVHEAPVETAAETLAELQAEEADVRAGWATPAEAAVPLRAAEPCPQGPPLGDPPTRPPRR